MRVLFLIAAIASLSTTATAAHAAEEVAAGCAIPHPVAGAHSWYVDPAHGDAKNDGSAQAPWKTIEEVVKAGLISTQRYVTPYKPGAALQPVNPNGKIKPGDTIYLRSGNQGTLELNGAINSEFITVEAEKGQTPVLQGLHVGGAGKWTFRGLTIQRTAAPKEQLKLVELLNHNFFGPTSNVVLADNHILSDPNVAAWTQLDWQAKAAFLGLVDEATCATIVGNDIRNIKNGMFITGSGALIKGNKIDNFGDDAIDIAASQLKLIGNRMTNNHDIADQNHNDGIQGWTLNNAINKDVDIEGNTVIVATDPGLPFPGTLQGISYFDGLWENYRVANNVVIVSAYHGISIYGGRNAEIVNNTVLSGNPKYNTWIGIFAAKPEYGGALPTGVIVRNNIATDYKIDKGVGDANLVQDHNIAARDPGTLFKAFDIAHARYDLHLGPASRARGAGAPERAPMTDIDGAARHAPFDLGAYAASP